MERDPQLSRECPPEKIIYDPQRGARICLETGQIIEEGVITEDAEWRAYTPEERQRRVRVGAPLSPSDVNFGVDASLVRRPGTKGPRMPVGGRAGRGIMSPGIAGLERNVQQALRKIEEMVGALELPDYIKDEASQIYRTAAARGLTRGRSISIMAAAAIFVACRKLNHPCTLDDIAKVVEAREGDVKREIGRCYRLLIRDLNIKPRVVKPEQYVSKIISKLKIDNQDLKDRIMTEANKIIELARKYGVTAGKDPSGLAAAAVYMAAQKLGVKKTQKEVATVAGVTEVTVRNRYKEIMKILNKRAT